MSNTETTTTTATAPRPSSASSELPPNPQDLPIHAIADDFDMANPYEQEAMGESIRVQGIINAVTIWQDEGKWWLLDGRNRIAAARSVGYRFKPTDFKVFVGDLAKAVAYAEAANSHRRHMSKEQKEKRAVKLIGKYPRVASRKLALMTGLSHTTITKLRKEQDGEDTSYKPLEKAWENASIAAQEQFVRMFRVDLSDLMST